MAVQPARRSNIALQAILVLTLLLAAITIVGYLSFTNQKATSHIIHFEVLSEGGFAIITLQAGNISIPKSTTVTTPWRRTVQISSGTEIYLTASNPTQTGTLTCIITMDGQAWKKESKTAPKDGVACAGIVP